jgi:hypothetical protein
MKLLIFFIYIILSTSLLADTYAICKLNNHIYSIKFTKNKIFMNYNNDGLIDWSDYVEKFSKEEVVLVKNEKEREPKVLLDLCDYVPNDPLTKQLYKNCSFGSSAFSKLNDKEYAKKAHELYNDMPPDYTNYKIDRIFGQMTVIDYSHFLSGESEYSLKIIKLFASNKYVCEAKSQTAF